LSHGGAKDGQPRGTAQGKVSPGKGGETVLFILGGTKRKNVGSGESFLADGGGEGKRSAERVPIKKQKNIRLLISI